MIEKTDFFLNLNIGELKCSKILKKTFLHILTTKTSKKKLFDQNWKISHFGSMFALIQDIFKSENKNG